MRRQRWLIILFVIFSAACQNIYDLEKYQYPEWQKGKIYTQLLDKEDASVFREFLVSTGYDTLLDRSGSYTILVPTDSAFQIWFADHPKYESDVYKIPYQLRESMVQYHILQNRWSRRDMSMLGSEGWIDETDPNNNRPTAYKRKTIFREPDKKYWITPRVNDLNTKQEYVTDSLSASYYRKVYTTSRKFLPIFYDEFFGLNNLGPQDYTFYYNRDYQYGDICIANSKLLGDEIPAENGFINMIDQVIIPPLNVEEYLNSEHDGTTTRHFLQAMYRFSDFSTNLTETLKQEAAIAGGNFDTLYNLSFGNKISSYPFDINNEYTGSGSGSQREKTTMRSHYGIMIPTDQAFENFLTNTLTGPDRWPDYQSVPDIIRWYFLSTHMSSTPIYRSTMTTGITNTFGETVELDESTIRETYYGSNATILLIDEMIESQAFTNISAPVLLQPGYEIMLYALTSTNTLDALNKRGEYVYYLSPDMSMENDSSLLIDLTSGGLKFLALDRGGESLFPTPARDLQKRILNQIGKKLPTGQGRKEFIENVAGNYLVVDNESNIVTGGDATSFGYGGNDSTLYLKPELLGSFNNGEVYEVETWFSTPTANLYSVINKYPKFSDLLKKAGLSSSQHEEIKFLDESKKHTIFIPSDLALENYGVDTLETEDLARLLKKHFVQGELIWTDGTAASGAYQTELESSHSDGFVMLEIETGIDYINILNTSDGSVFCHIPENGSLTNKMAAYTPLGQAFNDNRQPGRHDYTIKGVVHTIDKVIEP